ncbi:MAG: hypothetical protein P8Z79_01905 [Sedimentisphaerales bacterium]
MKTNESHDRRGMRNEGRKTMDGSLIVSSPFFLVARFRSQLPQGDPL